MIDCWLLLGCEHVQHPPLGLPAQGLRSQEVKQQLLVLVTPKWHKILSKLAATVCAKLLSAAVTVLFGMVGHMSLHHTQAFLITAAT